MPSNKELEITVIGDDRCTHFTNDLIQGQVCLNFDKDTKIDAPSITFEGKASTRVEKHAFLSNKAGHAFGCHTFLRLSHAVQSADMPENGVALRGQSYSTPFEFIVPENLLPYACTHDTTGESTVRRAHLQLPSSLGECSQKSSLIGSSGPIGAQVNYAIHVKVRKYFSDGTSIVLKKTRTVYVMPSRSEEPPIPMETNDLYYQLSQEKDVVRGPSAFGAISGRLTARTTGLPPLNLQGPHARSENSPTLQIPLNLCFSPATKEERPPRLDSIVLKLHSHTFYGAVPYEAIPRPEDSQSDCADRTEYTNTVKLGDYCLRDMKWSSQPVERSLMEAESKQYCAGLKKTAPSRRSGLCRFDDDLLPSYKLSLQIPINLPQNSSDQGNGVVLTPSFNCCLISRIYSIEIGIGYKTDALEPTKAPKAFCSSRSVARLLTPAAHVSLRVPLQVKIRSGRSPSPGVSVPQSLTVRPERLWFDDDFDGLSTVEQLPTYTPVS